MPTDTSWPVNRRGISYTIYDSALVREKERAGIHYQEAPGWSPPDTWICHIPLPGLEREMCKPHDVVKIADTWDELADWMEVDPDRSEGHGRGIQRRLRSGP